MLNDHSFLASEINELEALLASVPAGNLIERMSLEARLATARDSLAALPTQGSPKAILRFRGHIQERTETYQGELQGVLPISRTFEFKVSSDGSVIKGKLSRTIAEPDALNLDWLLKPVTMTLHVVQVGQGRPRFTLMSLDDLKRWHTPQSAPPPPTP